MTAFPREIEPAEPIADLSAEDRIRSARQTAIYVYEAPVRLWHWVNALAITVLAITGYLIATPLPTLPGEASANFLMGYIRFAHFTAGYVLAIGLAGRVYWALVGNRHARQLFYVPVWSGRYWRELLVEAKWYAFLVAYPKKYVGHNPLAQLAMFTLFLSGVVFMICTGFALYAEGEGRGGWTERVFGWVQELAVNSQNLHTLHHLGLWFIVIFVVLHVYAAIREDIMSRQS